MLKVVALLRPVTPQEGELFAGVLGAALIESIAAPLEGKSSEQVTLCWHLDNPILVSQLNKPSIDSSTSAVVDVPGRVPTEQLLAKLQAMIARGLLRVEHVPAHTGVRENELCDRACHWARTKGEHLLSGRRAAFCGGAAKIQNGEAWLIVDWRSEPFCSYLEQVDVLVRSIISEFYPKMSRKIL